MNYRHIYHAGSFADVFKHSILSLAIAYLCKKPKPCVFIDSHAGIGLYPLTDERAKRTQEAENGILKLLKHPRPIPELADYLKIYHDHNPSQQRIYPGSPLFMVANRRPDDQVILNELHPIDFELLSNCLKKQPNVHLHRRNGYEFLPAMLPPTPRRGLILIDPPYEKDDEYTQIQTVVRKCLEKFATGTYMIWYPIVDASDQKQIQKIIASLNIETLQAEFCLKPVFKVNKGLVGSGVLMINPPWKLETPIRKIISFLSEVFEADPEAKSFANKRLND